MDKTYEDDGEFTTEELYRIDDITEEAHIFLHALLPNSPPLRREDGTEWFSVQSIANILEAAQKIICDEMKLMTTQDFYPYRVSKEDLK